MVVKNNFQIPANVKVVLLADNIPDIHLTLRAQYDLTDVQYDFLLDSIQKVIERRVEVLKFTDHLQRMPASDQIAVQSLALQVALRRFWPLNDYLHDVDLLITRLGGRVPPPQPLPKFGDDEIEIDHEKPAWVQGSAKEILQKYRDYNDLYITQKPIRDVKGRVRPPSIANWLQEYLHTMGAGESDNMKRSQFLSRSHNALLLNNAEKQNLLNFLASYDEGNLVYWRIAEEQFLLVETELPKEITQHSEEAKAAQQMSDLMAYYKKTEKELIQKLENKKKEVQFSITVDVQKIADRIWDALGLEETEQCLVGFDVLIDRHALQEVLRSDQRFSSIVSRYIDVKYGTEAKTFWEGKLVTAVELALLWRLIMLEKLKMHEDKAAIAAHYFSRKLGQKKSPMYLDLKTGQFLFRSIAYKDRKFSFASS